MLEQIVVVRSSELSVALDDIIEDTVYTFLDLVDEGDEDEERLNVYDIFSKEEVNQIIKNLPKKKRREFLTVMDTYANLVRTLGIEISREYYNLVAFCSDVKNKVKTLD